MAGLWHGSAGDGCAEWGLGLSGTHWEGGRREGRAARSRKSGSARGADWRARAEAGRAMGRGMFKWPLEIV